MKKTFLLSCASVAFLAAAGGLTASQALALTSDEVIADLRGQGFTNIEVKVGPSQIKAEASNGTDKIEIVFDKATGEILKQELYPGAGNEVDPGIEVDQTRRNFVDDDDDDDDDDNSGHGSRDDDDDNSGHGSGGDDDDDHSGHGGGGDDDRSGSGGGGGNSGPGGGSDDD